MDITTKARWVLKESKLPWLMLDTIKFPYLDMLAEAKNLEYVPYRTANCVNWEVIALYGHDGDAKKAIYHHSTYGIDNPTPDWTEIAVHCPVTKNFLSSGLFNNFNRIRFMKLKPGGHIVLHNDLPNGADGSLRSNYVLGCYHFSLSQPKKCFFNIENWGDIPIKGGSCFLFCNAFNHELKNNSKHDRIHIIVHGEINMNYWEKHIFNAWNNFIKRYQNV